VRKLVFVMLFLITSVYSATIDITYFEGDGLTSKYETLSKNLVTKTPTTHEQKTRLRFENALISKIQSLLTKKSVVPSINIDILNKKSVPLKIFYQKISEYIELKYKVKMLENRNNELQERLLYLKSQIEALLAEQKDKFPSLMLQYSYYKLEQKQNNQNIKIIQSYLINIKPIFFNSIEYISADINLIKNELLQVEEEYKKLEKQKLSLNISKERELLVKESIGKRLAYDIDRYEKDILEIKSKKFNLLSQLILVYIQQKDKKESYALFKEIGIIVKNISKNGPNYDVNKEFIEELIINKFGTTSLIVNNTQKSVEDGIELFLKSMIKPLFIYNEQPVSTIDILKVVIIFVIGFFLARFYRRRVMFMKKRWPNMSLMSLKLFSNVGYYFIVMITIFIGLSSVGIDFSSISMIAGALSIGIGFGLQTVVSNLVAGIILMFERSIRIGDLIQIDDVLKGSVTDMRIRSTTLRTFDGIDIVIPNSSFIQNNVINWTLEDSIRRLHIPFSVAYGSDIAHVEEVVLQALRTSDLIYEKDDIERQPTIRLELMGASSLNMELLVWIDASKKIVPLKSDFLIMIYNTLKSNKIEIPFAQMDVRIKELPVTSDKVMIND